jgi:hypothetical protein
MHSLCKPLFFTTGTVGLLVLVFIWSALHYGLFSLDHLISALLKYRFAGYGLPEYLKLSDQTGVGERVYILKLFLTILVAFGSLFLIVISYFPKISLQFKTLSFVCSLHLFVFLALFWDCLIEGNEVIDKLERSAIFAFTIATYLAGTFSLWYAIRSKGERVYNNARSKIPNHLPFKKTAVLEEPGTSVSTDETTKLNTKDKTVDSEKPDAVSGDEFEEVENKVETNDQGESEDQAIQIQVSEADIEPNEEIEDESDDDELAKLDQLSSEISSDSIDEVVEIAEETPVFIDEGKAVSMESEIGTTTDEVAEGKLSVMPSSNPEEVKEPKVI